MSLFFTGIILLFLSGFIANLFNNKLKTTILSILVFISSILGLIPAVNVLLNKNAINQSFNFNELFGTVNFTIDSLSAFFILVITVMTTLSVIYSKGYLAPYIEKGKKIGAHLVFLPVLIASMLLVTVCSNAMFFLICWEVMSLSSFFLVIFEDEKKEVRQAAIRYLIFMHISVIFIILAFAILSINSGSFDFESFKTVLNSNHKLQDTIFLIAFIGFGTKAGFVPFHNWLPAAHPIAPSHVSAIMSGVMIKTGIYGILRILSLIETPSKAIGLFVLIISLISALYGVLYAITQHDIKRLLAYHSIENIGIIGIGIGVGILGVACGNNLAAILGYSGAVLHVLNHSIFKELLFLSAGSVYLKTHTKNVEILGGLIKSMPYTALLFLTGSIAICGLPPLNGFVSEFLIYFGMFKSFSIHDFFLIITMIFTIAGLALVGTMAVLCFTKAFSIIFLGSNRSENASNVQNDAPLSMIFPMTILGIFTVLIGVFPQYVFFFIKEIITSIINIENIVLFEEIELMKTVSIYALCFLIAIISICILKLYLTKNKIKEHDTWGCGYNRANNHMQYTASSYASPFLSTLKPLFKKVFDIEKPKKLFPKKAHFNLHIEDIEEAYIINPLIKFDEKILSKFETLQSGNLQSYIKYGLLFLVIMIIISLFIG